MGLRLFKKLDLQLDNVKVSEFVGLVEKVVRLRGESEEEEDDGDEDGILGSGSVGCKENNRVAISELECLAGEKVWENGGILRGSRNIDNGDSKFWNLDTDCVAVSVTTLSNSINLES